MSTVPNSAHFAAARFGSWALRQWPVPLVAAGALIVMLAAQQFGAMSSSPAYLPEIRAAATAKFQGLPLAFEENRGQVDPQVRFITHGSGYTQFVTSQQFVAVRLTDLYSGISLKLYGTRQRPEYDFLLEPGADPDVIRLRFAGAEQIEVGARGELIVRTPAGELIHHQPVAYQRDGDGQSRVIDARFVQTAPDELRFELGRYDRSRSLVIDPVYQYSTDLGGSSGSEGLGGSAVP